MDRQIEDRADYVLITEDDELNKYCNSWQELPYLGLDTEFMRIDSFYPRVALIQLNDGLRNYLIDPLKINDWSRFSALMQASHIVKIFHSCSEDLLVFIRQFGFLPVPVFDTQIANAFLNQGFAVSYQNMLAEQLSIDIPKAETRSNWLQRPLSARQLEYAALDVAYLPEIYERQRMQLSDMQRLSWLEEDCQRLNTVYRDELTQDFSQSYRNIGGAWQLDQQQLMVLKKLAEWRELRARERDKPRNWIIKDKELLKIAKTTPENTEQLTQINDLNPNFLHYEGDRVIDLIHSAQKPGEEKLPERLPRPLSGGQIKLFKKAQHLIEKKADELKLPIEVLGRKRTLLGLFQEILQLKSTNAEANITADKLSLPEELQGWRRALIVDELVDLLR